MLTVRKVVFNWEIHKSEMIMAIPIKEKMELTTFIPMLLFTCRTQREGNGEQRSKFSIWEDSGSRIKENEGEGRAGWSRRLFIQKAVRWSLC